MSNMSEDEDEDERVDIEANLFDGRLEGLAKWWLWLHPILITFSQHVIVFVGVVSKQYLLISLPFESILLP